MYDRGVVTETTWSYGETITSRLYATHLVAVLRARAADPRILLKQIVRMHLSWMAVTSKPVLLDHLPIRGMADIGPSEWEDVCVVDEPLTDTPPDPSLSTVHPPAVSRVNPPG